MSKEKKTIKVRDLKPQKDAKGGGHVTSGHLPSGHLPSGHQPSGTNPNNHLPSGSTGRGVN